MVDAAGVLIATVSTGGKDWISVRLSAVAVNNEVDEFHVVLME